MNPGMANTGLSVTMPGLMSTALRKSPVSVTPNQASDWMAQLRTNGLSLPMNR
ncbi:MAG: hypothetical protein GY913_01545 [Proteobacteria bacterium]|nr:hypothetical protein [Pseudomonadota bacterium]MCP4915583.1 hypothetical protein [Pseudomonadota bacterium]